MRFSNKNPPGQLPRRILFQHSGTSCEMPKITLILLQELVLEQDFLQRLQPSSTV